ncbi:MAG: YitT family protein [Clostridia bacterium]|nr:YitT family protein [Clostridia bacterium]
MKDYGQSKGRIAASYVFVILVAILLAFNYQLFIVTNGFAPAGLNGIATMVQYKTGFSIGYMSLLINVPLCVAAFFLIDKTFALRSLVFSVSYSFFYLFLQKVGFSQFQYNAGGHDTIYPVLLSGAISGFVYGVCFLFQASTGGTDILSKYISFKKPNLNFFWVTFALNVVVAVASFFVYATPDTTGQLQYDYKPVCLCILYCFISSFVGSFMISGTKSAVKVTIITEHPNEIMKRIAGELKHSSTYVPARGSFSSREKTLLISVVNRHQLMDLQKILSCYDRTFSFCESVSQTFGNFKFVK